MTPLTSQFQKLWLQINLKEAWELNFTHGYYLEPQGPQPLASFRDLRLTIIQAKHDASAPIAATVDTNAPASDQSCAADAAITALRVRRPAAVGPPWAQPLGPPLYLAPPPKN